MAAVARWKELCMDTTGGEDLGRFWAAALGLAFHADNEAGYLTGPTEGHGIAMCVVPEPKTVKNRIHWDVYGEADELIAAGATLLRAPDDEISWHVLADPEGNEFCCFEPADR